MIAQIYTILQIILGAFGLWDAFVLHLEEEQSKAREADRQAREAAIDESKKEGKSDDAIFENQGDIISHLPKP